MSVIFEDIGIGYCTFKFFLPRENGNVFFCIGIGSRVPRALHPVPSAFCFLPSACPVAMAQDREAALAQAVTAYIIYK